MKMTVWRPDILGSGFECTDIDLGEDVEGKLQATLVRHLAAPLTWLQRMKGHKRPLEGADVLYVHGWSDYFFQRRMARFWADKGANFYALDLRRYGRSLRPGQTPGYIDDLAHYDDEIGLALDLIRSPSWRAGTNSSPAPPTPSRRPLILLGHSTGGLVLSLWSARHPGVADSLVLNSPWLEFQLTSVGRQMLMPLVDLRARFHAKEASNRLDFGFYARAQREVQYQEDPLDVNPDWRPERAHAVSAGWLRAVLQGQARVAEGLDLTAPVCVLLSAESAVPLRWSDELTRADTVLDVHEVALASLKLGSSVTIERVDGALHDIFLSRREAREDAYSRLDRWVRGWAASRE